LDTLASPINAEPAQSHDWNALKKYIPRAWARDADLVVESGQGCWLSMVGGDRYLDFTSGIAVTNTGHAHPRVVGSIVEQVPRLLHGQQSIVFHKPGLELHARLPRYFPNGQVEAQLFLTNSGAEAVEAAVKLAKISTRRPAIVAFRGGFHGRTHATMALSSSMVRARASFEPLLPSVYLASYPNAIRRPGGSTPTDATDSSLASVEELFRTLVDPSDVAAVLVEPILGEGGYVVPPDDFLPRLKALIQPHGILLIADEIQTGFARTGRMFATEWTSVAPDILVVGKAIASGLPLSGILAPRQLMDNFGPGANGGTFGGNVVSCAAAVATLDVIETEGLADNAALRGAALVSGLLERAEGLSYVAEVRGRGLMIGIEFADPQTLQPRPELTKQFVDVCRRERLLVKTCGVDGHVVRLMPPLILTDDEVQFALRAMDSAFWEVSKEIEADPDANTKGGAKGPVSSAANR
jgi:4-aminobutyrate aminotransferase